MVERYVRDVEVASSNLVTPIELLLEKRIADLSAVLFLYKVIQEAKFDLYKSVRWNKGNVKG